MILSRLDYCNGLLGGIPEYLNNRLNTVLCAAARLALDLPRICHIRDVMRKTLHWLEFPNRVTFKLSTLAFQCLHGTSPEYLARSCVPSDRPHLRSFTNFTSGLPVVPPFRTVPMWITRFPRDLLCHVILYPAQLTVLPRLPTCNGLLICNGLRSIFGNIHWVQPTTLDQNP